MLECYYCPIKRRVLAAMEQALPPGYHEIEAYSNGSEIVVIGRVSSDDEDHNCDAMGCSSVGGHVVYRGPVNLPTLGGEGGAGDVE